MSDRDESTQNDKGSGSSSKSRVVGLKGLGAMVKGKRMSKPAPKVYKSKKYKPKPPKPGLPGKDTPPRRP
jgi:hypothetical protein